MKRFEKILGYIPPSASEGTVLNWCGKIAQYAHSKSVELIICYEDFQTSGQSGDFDWDLFVKEEVKRISELVEKDFSGTELTVTVLQDSPVKGVLNRLSGGLYDLLVLPKESSYGMSFVEKLARKSPVGVLVVPQDSEPSFQSIMLGVDFSGVSSLALDWAEAFAKIHAGSTELHALHVVSMPRHSKALQATDPQMLRSRLMDVSTNGLTDFLEEHSEKPSQWNKIIAEHPLAGVQMLREATAKNSDLIVIGSHGRHALSVALLGGQTSDVIRESEVPVLVAKRKNESLGFLKQLLGLNS